MLDDRVNPDSLPEDIELREEVLDCFPEADSHHGYPLPEHLPQVCVREGMCYIYFIIYHMEDRILR